MNAGPIPRSVAQPDGRSSARRWARVRRGTELPTAGAHTALGGSHLVGISVAPLDDVVVYRGGRAENLTEKEHRSRAEGDSSRIATYVSTGGNNIDLVVYFFP